MLSLRHLANPVEIKAPITWLQDFLIKQSKASETCLISPVKYLFFSITTY